MAKRIRATFSIPPETKQLLRDLAASESKRQSLNISMSDMVSKLAKEEHARQLAAQSSEVTK